MLIVLCALLVSGGIIAMQSLLGTLPASYAATPPDSCFNFDTATKTINGYYDNEGNNAANPACPRAIDIPATIAGTAVENIASFAFKGKGLVALTLPDGLKTIGYAAFKLNNLIGVTLPATLTDMGMYSFQGNPISSVTIPDGITTIPNGAFDSDDLTTVTIPSTVTNISDFAFSGNKLQTITLPDSVTTVGSYSFCDNLLESVTLGAGLTTINDSAFAINKLRDVTLPAAVSTVSPAAFYGQNPWGGAVDESTDPAHDWWSSDPSVVQGVYDNIWYATLHTNGQTNIPNGIVPEAWYIGVDQNNDGTMDNSLGGQIVDAASLTVQYHTAEGVDLLAAKTLTGRESGGLEYSDYLAKAVASPEVIDPTAPTTSEQSAIDAALSVYFRLGQTVSLTAPTIPNYSLASPASPTSVTLSGPSTTTAFTYSPSQATTQPTTPTPAPVTTSPSTTPSKQSTTPTPATQPQASEQAINTPETTVDLSQSAAPANTSPLLASSTLSADPSQSCNSFTSSSLVSPASLTASHEGTTLGGVSLALACTDQGGHGQLTLTLGDTVPASSTLRVYAASASSITDITNQVTISKTADGKHTRVTFGTVDGGAIDSDGAADRIFRATVYLASVMLPAQPATSLPESIAATRLPWWQSPWVIGGAIVGVLGATGTGMAFHRLRRR